MKFNVYLKFSLFLLFFGLFFIFFYNFYFSIKVYDDFSKNTEKLGYLYSILNRNENKAYFIVLDKRLENLPRANFPTFFKIDFLDEAKIWDPTVCAGMPTLINKNNIWMMDFRVGEGQKIEKILIKYNKNDNTKYYLNLSKYNIIGDLSFEDEKLIFKIEENNNIYNVKIEDHFYESLKYRIFYNFFGIYLLSKNKISDQPAKYKKIDMKEYVLNLDFLEKENVKYYIIGEYKEN